MMRWSVGLLMVLAACGGSEDPEATGPVWYGDIEPLMRDNCQQCHQPDGAGSFSLADYSEAKAWSVQIADAVADRRMPPWLATDDGSCGNFRDSRWMEQEDIDRIVAWADGGAAEGDPADGQSELPPLPTLARTDIRVDTPVFTPEIVGGVFAKYDEYRCFLFDNPTDEDVFITGFEVDPGYDAVVHHVIGMPVAPEGAGWYRGTTNRQVIESVNGADGRDGWPCFGTAGDGISETSYPVTWAPGMGAVAYPEGTGVRLKSDDWFVVQVHYNLVDPDTHGTPDSTGVALEVVTEVEHELFYALPDGLLDSWFTGVPDTLPPGEDAYAYKWTMNGSDILSFAGISSFDAPANFKVWGVMPHMHALGTRLEAKMGGECLVEVADWDFNWQLAYFYDEPMTVGKSDKLNVTCTYDTSDELEPVVPGWGTYNEMCLLTMMFSID